jgi:hypothetical protein
MARNWPGPYSVEYKYVISSGGVSMEHSLELNCAVIGSPAVGAVPGSIAVQTKSGASLALLTAVNDVWNIFRSGLGGSGVATGTGWTLWKYVPNSLAKDFITAGSMTNPLGSAAGQAVVAGQEKLTFRTANGGILQVNMLEGNTGGTAIIPLIPAGTGAWSVVMASYLLSSSGWVIARDDSFPVAALNRALGQNEAVFNKRYRNY